MMVLLQPNALKIIYKSDIFFGATCQKIQLERVGFFQLYSPCGEFCSVFGIKSRGSLKPYERTTKNLLNALLTNRILCAMLVRDEGVVSAVLRSKSTSWPHGLACFKLRDSCMYTRRAWVFVFSSTKYVLHTWHFCYSEVQHGIFWFYVL